MHFVSRKEAQDRLDSGRNLFRDKAAPIPESEEREESDGVDKSKRPNGSPSESPEGSVEGARYTGVEDIERPLFDLSSLDAIISGDGRKPRYQGKVEAQASIAETSMVLGPTVAASLVGLGTSQTFAYEHGYRNSGQQYDGTPQKPELKRRIDIIKEDLALRASSKLKSVLINLTDEKLQKVKRATNLSKIGKDMAIILDKVSPSEQAVDGGTHFHIYRPEVKTINNYETVVVGSSSDK